jgi:hypothetical protein
MKEFKTIPWKIKDVWKVFILSFVLGFSAYMLLSFFNVFEQIKSSVEFPALQSFYLFLLYLVLIGLVPGKQFYGLFCLIFFI